ncbi:MAG TPA: tetratricopeptide repeat protein, partial [Anaerolineales bacterium]|nr:tetratricopeptide repeat protein [Anaerolineales bacterium]
MQLRGEGLPLGRPGRTTNPWRILAYLAVIGAAFLVFRGYQAGQIQPFLLPTPTPTRTSSSHAQEGQAHFSAGRVAAAIEAYREGVAVDPTDARLAAELARIQTYSSAFLTTAEEREARLLEARQSIDAAVEASPDDAFVHAVRTLVYDWSAAVEPLPAERD